MRFKVRHLPTCWTVSGSLLMSPWCLRKPLILLCLLPHSHQRKNFLVTSLLVYYIFILLLFKHNRYQFFGNTVLMSEQVSGVDYNFDLLMEKLAASGCTVFLVILSFNNVNSFFNATRRNAKMASHDIVYIGSDGWAGSNTVYIPTGALGVNTFLSINQLSEKYNSLWASLGD